MTGLALLGNALRLGNSSRQSRLFTWLNGNRVGRSNKASAGAWPSRSWDMWQHLSRLSHVFSDFSLQCAPMGGHQGKGLQQAVFSLPSGYDGLTIISNRCGQAITDLSWVATSPILKFNQITSRVKDARRRRGSSALSLAIIGGLTFLCNGAFSLLCSVHVCVHTWL